MDTLENSHSTKVAHFRTVAGVVLLMAGGILFLDRYLKTGWLSLIILPAVGLFLYLWGIRLRHVGLILAGGLLGGLGAGSMEAWGPGIQIGGPGALAFPASPHGALVQIGLMVLYTGIGWGVVIVTTTALTQSRIWWALVPGSAFVALGCCLLFSPLKWYDFVLYLAAGIGLSLLLWGILARLIGLIIPGALLLGAGTGVYLAWRSPDIGNGLVQTGIMLVGFACGWLLITAAARWITHQYIWWPLIPGGILAVVGIGLYIGGDPTHALGFIGNTGSIALMIFGLYLLLMRKGIHH